MLEVSCKLAQYSRASLPRPCCCFSRRGYLIMPESEPLAESVRVSRPPVEPFEAADTDTPHLAPVREGLPPGFRMRADAHYVDQLDSRMSSIPVRLIDASAIETGPSHSDAIA